MFVICYFIFRFYSIQFLVQLTILHNIIKYYLYFILFVFKKYKKVVAHNFIYINVKTLKN